MERDKELLLPMEATDSDDVVEEFKLPPPRTRRPKARKAVAEARIAASQSSLLSGKCCLMFILLSTVIAGALVLAFFMLSMQSEISDLTLKLTKVNIKLAHQAQMEISSKKFMQKLGEYKRTFSKQDLNNKLLAHKILKLNLTVLKLTTSLRKLGSAESLVQRVSTLSADVGSLKSGMAQTGGDIAKVQSEIVEHGDKFDSILTELKNVKIMLYKSTSQKNKTRLQELIRPISAQTEEIGKLKEVMRRINGTLTRNTQRIALEIYNQHVEHGKEFKQLQVLLGELNTTHISDSSNTAQIIATYQNRTQHDMTSNTFAISILSNTTETLGKQIQHHHKQIKKIMDIESDVKSYHNVSTSNLLKIKSLTEELNHHKHMIENQTKRISLLQGDSAVTPTTVHASIVTTENIKAAQYSPTTMIIQDEQASTLAVNTTQSTVSAPASAAEKQTGNESDYTTAMAFEKQTVVHPTELANKTAEGNGSTVVVTAAVTAADAADADAVAANDDAVAANHSTGSDQPSSPKPLSTPLSVKTLNISTITQLQSHSVVISNNTKQGDGHNSNHSTVLATSLVSALNSTHRNRTILSTAPLYEEKVEKNTTILSTETMYEKELRKVEHSTNSAAADVVSTMTAQSKKEENNESSIALQPATQAPAITSLIQPPATARTSPATPAKPDLLVDDVRTEFTDVDLDDDDLVTPSSFLMPQLPDETSKWAGTKPRPSLPPMMYRDDDKSE